MKYQDCVERTQAGDAFPDRACWSNANINPRTGLATEYLNHFNEAVMLLKLLPTCPECLEEFLAWRPLSYREHFARSRLQCRDLAIAAYETAEPAARDSLDALATAMIEMLRRPVQRSPAACRERRPV